MIDRPSMQISDARGTRIYSSIFLINELYRVKLCVTSLNNAATFIFI